MVDCPGSGAGDRREGEDNAEPLSAWLDPGGPAAGGRSAGPLDGALAGGADQGAVRPQEPAGGGGTDGLTGGPRHAGFMGMPLANNLPGIVLSTRKFSPGLIATSSRYG